jgi:hypothetical protein
MNDADDVIGMPRAALAIRLGLFVGFAVGLTLVVLFDGGSQPFLFGTGVVLAIVFGAASILFHVIGWVQGSYVEQMEVKDFHHAPTGHRNSCNDSFDGGSTNFGD